MNITFTKAYVANGNTYATIEEAKDAALTALFTDEHEPAWTVPEIANHIAEHADEIIDILTTTATSKPSARKINGGTKKRKPKTPKQPQLPNTEAA